MVKSGRCPVVLAGALALICSAMPAQETVEGRLLNILKARGVITESEFSELKGLETQMRLEEDLASEVDLRIDEMVARVDDAPPSTSYKVGKGFSWTTADKRFKLTVGGRLQVRFTADFWEDNPETDDEDELDFDVPRARVWLRGNVFETYMEYKFQFDIAGDEADTEVFFPNGSSPEFSSDNRLSEMKDGYFDFTKWSTFSIRGGQFKVPYSRHQLVSSGKLEFVDRAVTNKVFAPGRNVGLMIHGKAGGENSDLFEYYAGAFDGEGENKTNDDEGLMFAGRIAVNPFGGVAYTESDLKQTDEFKMAVGVNAWVHQDDNHADEHDDWSIGADIAAFYKGFFGMFELHYRENGVSGGGSDVEILGWVAQLGYMIIPHELEFALRAANVDWDHNGTGDAARREYLAVLGYFWHEHNMKLQLDLGRIEDHEGDHADNIEGWVARLQFQIIF